MSYLPSKSFPTARLTFEQIRLRHLDGRDSLLGALDDICIVGLGRVYIQRAYHTAGMSW